MKKLQITETILRDGHQSQAATRMKTSEMLPVLDKIDKIGYYSVECWGGATFDSCLRFLNEDPWERLKTLKEAMPNTKLQMLLRGQNLLGYKHYSDDVVDMFVKKSIENGIDILRIFDALNDIRNLEQAIKSTKKYGGIVEAALSYTKSPVHNLEYFVDLSKKLKNMGADTICIKDMANLLLPYEAYELVKAIKSEVDLPIHLHTHNTTGTGSMTYLKAAEAGVDIVDTCLTPLANGTSQPGTESLVATLQGTEFDTGLDLIKLTEIANHFKGVAERLKSDGFLDPKVLNVDVKTLIYQIPGGMLSNLIKQLKEQGASDKYDEVLAEVPRVREDMGYPPLVTPTSQIVGTQAVLNVVMGERYKMVTSEIKGLLKGEYGKLPAEPKQEVIKKCIGDEKRITCRPADLLEPSFDKYKEEMMKYYTKEEDVLSYCLFPKVAENFFKQRDKEHKRFIKVKVGGKQYEVEVEDYDYIAPKVVETPAPQKQQSNVAPAPVQPQQTTPSVNLGNGQAVNAPMPGTVIKLKFKTGDKVKKGDVLLVLEAMKMENDIVSNYDGVVTYAISEGAHVESGSTLCKVG
ncbi:MAG: oxaloacetate decarboxylase subunit alpha [Clostridia bacterium]|nr:oxaloacetate decarboxylase subunit alpha [Clostridia bacterium]